MPIPAPPALKCLIPAILLPFFLVPVVWRKNKMFLDSGVVYYSYRAVKYHFCTVSKHVGPAKTGEGKVSVGKKSTCQPDFVNFEANLYKTNILRPAFEINNAFGGSPHHATDFHYEMSLLLLEQNRML